MLRKISHIIITTLLLVSTTGLVFSKHYCGNNLVSVSLFIDAESCCGSADCCHNESVFIQIDNDFSVGTSFEFPSLLAIDILGNLPQIEIFVEKTLIEKPDFIEADIPPPPKIQDFLSEIQTYLL